MFDIFNPEEAFNRKLEALEKQNNQLDLEIEQFMIEHNLTPEKLSIYLSQKERFSEESWEKLEQERQKLESKLTRELALIKKKKETGLGQIQRHWIPAR